VLVKVVYLDCKFAAFVQSDTHSYIKNTKIREERKEKREKLKKGRRKREKGKIKEGKKEKRKGKNYG
jgi:hypothetical protein